MAIAPVPRPPVIRLSFRLGYDLSSRLIAWWGQAIGGWSHVAAMLPSGELLDARSDKLGDVPAGVQIRPEALEPAKRTALVELPGGDPVAWEEWLKSKVGARYDDAAIVGDIVGRQFHGKGRWICSALQTQALKHAGLIRNLPMSDSLVTPDALYLIVTAGLGGKIVRTAGH